MNATPTILHRSLETLQVLLSRFEDVHDIWQISLDLFCHIFCSLNLVDFGLISTEAYRHWLSCECNSSTIVPIYFQSLQVFAGFHFHGNNL